MSGIPSLLRCDRARVTFGLLFGLLTLAPCVHAGDVPAATPLVRLKSKASVAARSRDDGGSLVHLKATGPFDPLRGVPRLVESELQGRSLETKSGLGPVLVVQVSGPVTRSCQADLERAGYRVLDYVPENALLVRAPTDVSADAVSRIRGVRAAFALTPGFRASPELMTRVGRPAPAPGALEASVLLDAFLFSDASVDTVARVLRAAFPSLVVKFTAATPPLRVRFEVPAADVKGAVSALLPLAEVEFIELAHQPELANDNSVWIGQSYDRQNGPNEAQAPDPKPYSLSATVWSHNLLGQGQIIGISDFTFDYVMSQFDDPAQPIVRKAVQPPGALEVNSNHRKVLAVNAPSGDFVAYGDAHDCVRHGTHVAGIIVGDSRSHLAGPGDPGHDLGDGMAPLAKLIVQQTPAGPGVDTSLSAEMLQHYNAGARILNFSWNMANDPDLDSAVWQHQDLTVFAAAGNEGISAGARVPGSLGSFNKNAIIVGSCENYDASFVNQYGPLDPENMVAGSSEGPPPDNRIKPDLAAQGFFVRSSKFPSPFYPAGDPHCNPNDPDVCMRPTGSCNVLDRTQAAASDLLLGTSMASPTAAGLAALARQYFTEGFYPSGQPNAASSRVPSAALIKAVLINGARNMTGHNFERRGSVLDQRDFGPLEDAPGYKQGWGRVMLDDVLDFGASEATQPHRRLFLLDLPDAQGLGTNDSTLQHVTIGNASAAEPLKITLAWTDPPGSVVTGKDLRNDLDIVVTAPNGTVYRGNQWLDDVAVRGDKRSAPNATGRDSVNNVEGILVPAPASGLYKIEIKGAVVPGYNGVYTQGFALVVTAKAESIVGQPCTLAAPPQALQATVARWDDVVLSWQTVPGAIGYKVRRNTIACSAGPTDVFDVAASPYHDRTTQPATTYFYTVRAVMGGDGCQTESSNCVVAATLPPPAVTAVTPDNGPNNDPTQVTVTGTDFMSNSALYLGTAAQPQKYALTGLIFDSPTQMRGTAPVNLQSGVYTLTAVNPDAQSGSKASAFIVSAPLQTVTAFTADYDNVGKPNYTVSLVDVQGTASTATISVGPNTGPTDVAIRADHSLGVVSYWWPTEKVAIVQPLAQRVLQTVNLPTGRRGQGVVLDPAGAYAYVMSRSPGTPAPAYLSKLDLTTKTFVTHVPIGQGILNWPSDDVAITPDGTKVCATNSYSGTVSVLQTSNMAVLATVPVGTTPVGLAVSSDSSKLYVANQDSSSVSVVSLSTYAVTQTIAVSGAGQPQGLALSNADTLLQVACTSGIVTLNPSTGAKIRTGAAGTSFRRLIWLASTGKLYGLNGTSPSRVYRINPSTLALETYGTGGSYPTGMDVADPKSPTIVSIAPNTACKNGGSQVAITGSRFQGEVRNDANQIVQQRTRVYFGTTEATNVTLVNSTQLLVVVPAHAAGTVSIQVTNPSGKSATLTNGFVYLKLNCEPEQ